MSRSPNAHIGLNLGPIDGATDDKVASTMFGFWIFMMTDLVVFALLMSTYASMSVHGIAGGPSPNDLVDIGGSAVETAVLLLSSLTCGFASIANKYEHDGAALRRWLVATALLGVAFLTLEGRDFVHLSAIDAGPTRSGFLTSHAALLGCHWLHVAAGLLWIVVLLVQSHRVGATPAVKLRVMRLAVFWHMLDVVWICLFTLVVLLGVGA